MERGRPKPTWSRDGERHAGQSQPEAEMERGWPKPTWSRDGERQVEASLKQRCMESGSPKPTWSRDKEKQAKANLKERWREAGQSQHSEGWWSRKDSWMQAGWRSWNEVRRSQWKTETVDENDGRGAYMPCGTNCIGEGDVRAQVSRPESTGDHQFHLPFHGPAGDGIVFSQWRIQQTWKRGREGGGEAWIHIPLRGLGACPLKIYWNKNNIDWCILVTLSGIFLGIHIVTLYHFVGNQLQLLCDN